MKSDFDCCVISGGHRASRVLINLLRRREKKTLKKPFNKSYKKTLQKTLERKQNSIA